MGRPQWIFLLAAALAGSVVCAESVTNDKDFTYKRVKVQASAPGQRRILVQINPGEQARILAINPAVAAALRPGEKFVPPDLDMPGGLDGAVVPVPHASYAWYWDVISPRLSDSQSGRLETAVAALGKGPGGKSVAAPRLASLQRIADEHGAAILNATVGTKVSPALVLAVIATESGGRRTAVSPAGAAGLMQLMPATAARFGVADRNNAAANIRGGVAYLDWLLDHFNRDPIMALAGYNAGENAVHSNAGVPPYAETRDYVPKVLAAWNVAKGLCLTPPQLVSDGCVFRRGMQTAQAVN